MARLPRGAGARSAVTRAARRTLADAETAVFDANILAGAATAARKVRDAAIVSVCARTRLCDPRLLAVLSSRERETHRSPGREARVYWSTRSTSALLDATAKRFRGRDFLNPERRVMGRQTEPEKLFTSRLARDDRSGNSVKSGIWYPLSESENFPRYPFRVAKPHFRTQVNSFSSRASPRHNTDAPDHTGALLTMAKKNTKSKAKAKAAPVRAPRRDGPAFECPF